MVCMPSSDNRLVWSIEPENITCIADCKSYSNGIFYQTKIGKKRKLVERNGYRWNDINDNLITEVKCEIKDLGNFTVISEEQAHKLVDIDECREMHDAFTCPMSNGLCFNVPGSYQ